MPTSACTFASTYRPRNGDVVLLPYCDKKTPCFPKALLPKGLPAPVAPSKEGGARTVFSGALGKSSVLVRAVRLDGKVRSRTAQAAAMIRTAMDLARKEEGKRVVVLFDARHDDLLLAAHEGALLGGYVFDKYLSKTKKPLPVLVAAKGGLAKVRRKAKESEGVYRSVNFARDVLNGPPNEIHPESLAKLFAKEGKAAGLKVTTWNEARLRKEKCGGILAVGQGGKSRPRLVLGEYRPRGAKKHLCLVGKGVTFDTGGYCVKPGSSQGGMKNDMGGAAMVWGGACAIARLKLPIRLTVLAPLAENDIDAAAYHVDDILTTRSGRTVEVKNTDAEGRLILADALALAGEKKPDWIVDAATLTGACVVALGEELAGAYGTDPAFTRTLVDAGAAAGEGFWEMPLYEPYAEQLKSDLADCQNIGKGRWGGSITAALFLKKWVDDAQTWVHLDIAGPGIHDKPLGHMGAGSKGFGVKTLAELARRLT